jgi:polyhydroxybutyrate depolymerase
MMSLSFEIERASALTCALILIGMLAPQWAGATTYTAGRTTTAGATFYTGQQNVLSATQVRTGAIGGTLSAVTIYVGNVHAAPFNHMQVGIYADNAANAPGNLVTQSSSVVLQPNSWNSFTMPATSLAANTSYWLVFNVDGSATQVAIAPFSGGRTAWRYPATFGAWPAAFGTPSRPISSQQYSIYMTYSSDESPPDPPVGGTPGCGLPITPGAMTRTLTVNGAQRTYLVVVPPAGLGPNTATPIIMGFHGGSGTSAQARQSYGLEGSEPVIYVYPQAPYWPEAGGVGWNVDPAGVDFPYFDAMLNDLKNRHCIDTNRVFAAGKSNGGFFVNSLACNRPSAVRALASVAGGGPQNHCTQPKPAMIVHGTADTTVPIGTGRYSRDYWLLLNQHPNSSPEPASPPPCVSYPGTLNPVLWCQHGGAHTWPTWVGSGIRNFFLSLQ